LIAGNAIRKASSIKGKTAIERHSTLKARDRFMMRMEGARLG
jgi:hypothetical protein